MKTIELTCPNCNKIYLKSLSQYKSNQKRDRANYCSLSCSSSAYNNTIKQELVDCICTNCKKPFQRKPKDIKSEKVFCSKSCSNKSRSKTKPKKEYFCKKCKTKIGQGYMVSKYCKRCNSNIKDWRLVTLKQMKEKYSLNQYHARLRSLSRSAYQRSNKNKCCSNCNYSLHYEVCHIKGIKEFEETATVEEVNSPENLIALCRNCHWEFDNNYLKL